MIEIYKLINLLLKMQEIFFSGLATLGNKLMHPHLLCPRHSKNVEGH